MSGNFENSNYWYEEDDIAEDAVDNYSPIPINFSKKNNYYAYRRKNAWATYRKTGDLKPFVDKLEQVFYEQKVLPIKYYDPVDEWYAIINKSKSFLARPEIMVPRQRSIRKTWEYVENLMVPRAEEKPEPVKLRLRDRLGLIAMTGSTGAGSAAGFNYMLTGTPITSVTGAVVAGGVGVAGAGYVGFRVRSKNKQVETEPEVKTETAANQLTIEQFTQLSETFKFMGVPVGYSHGYGEAELKSLEVINGSTYTAKAERLLKWIDEASTKESAAAMAERTYATDAEKAWGYFDHTRQVQCIKAINESFGLPHWPSTPLTLLALTRMTNRGAFMTEYADEFVAIQEKQAEMTKVQESLTEERELRKLVDGTGTATYFGLRIQELEQTREDLRKEIILFDLKIAALAYAYQHEGSTLASYEPAVSEKSRHDQIALWQAAIDELCAMPIKELPAPMANVMIEATKKLITVEQDGRYGQIANDVVRYMQNVAAQVTDDGVASEVLRKIDGMLLPVQKSLE